MMRKKSAISYDGQLGRWWQARSMDGVHRRAYRNVADFVRRSFSRDPALIIDYACGPGPLLALLSRRFPHSKLIGLDGSRIMLELARRRLARLPAACSGRIDLVRTALPDPGVLPGKADLVVYCFPNMIPISGDAPAGGNRLSAGDRRIAQRIQAGTDVHEREGAADDASLNPDALEMGRCISRDLRRLLADGGICIRVEYATAQRHELSPEELEYVSFEEGSLGATIGGRRPRIWFRLLASAYFRSGVLEDVYEQTGDARDRNGGYLITVLRAV